MGIPAHIATDRRIGDEEAVANALESADVTPLEDERLSRLHRILYPVFRVTFSFTETDAEDGFLVRNEQGRTDRILIDGLWSGNDAALAPYTDGTVEASTTTTTASEFDFGSGEEPGPTILLGFQAANEHAAGLLPDRIERYTEDNGYRDGYAADLRATFDFEEDLDFGRFDDVVDVSRVYLPFWLAEFHDATEENAVLRSFRTPEDVRRDSHAHQWLADYVGEDPSRLAEYAVRTGATEDSSDEKDPRRPSPDREVVQPEGVDLDAESLVTVAPQRGFEDVGGMDDLKRALERKVLEPLSRPSAYEEYGIGTVTGVLLHGPPGCGKTYLAGALAGELGHTFLPVTPADVTSKWMGRPAKNVAEVFDIARANQPCVVFIDEIDAIAGSRAGEMNTSEQQMVDQLLTELEVTAGGEADVLVLAATNRVEDVDRAIRRSGRFDERIEVPPPDAEARREILSIHLDGRPTAADIDWDPIVEATDGYAASDLALLAENAAREALRANEPVGTDHLRAAADATGSSITSWLTDGGDAATTGSRYIR